MAQRSRRGRGRGGGTASALVGALGAACPVCGVAVGVGLAGYAAYGLVNGGAEALAASASRFANGTATDEDYFAAGNLVGGAGRRRTRERGGGGLAAVTLAEARRAREAHAPAAPASSQARL